MTDVRDELVRAQGVFINKITEQARQICWIRAVVYSKVGEPWGDLQAFHITLYSVLKLSDISDRCSVQLEKKLLMSYLKSWKQKSFMIDNILSLF